MSDNETVREVLRQLEAERVKKLGESLTAAAWMTAGATVLATGLGIGSVIKKKVDHWNRAEAEDRDALLRAQTELVEIKTRLRDLERQTPDALIHAEADRQAEAVRSAFLSRVQRDQRAKDDLKRGLLERNAKNFVSDEPELSKPQTADQIAEAVRAEREACATLADQTSTETDFYCEERSRVIALNTAKLIASKIRIRSRVTVAQPPST